MHHFYVLARIGTLSELLGLPTGSGPPTGIVVGMPIGWGDEAP
jgi:hypothetical protein